MIRGDSGQRDNMGEKISPGVRGGDHANPL